MCAQCIESDGIETFPMVAFEMRQELGAHPPLPKSLNMLCDAHKRFIAVRHRRKKLADAIRHTDEVARIHRSIPLPNDKC
ncbi:hypothetical protein THIX_20691 [Thiomonas sp. X19]|nr:hypothetical protein THIX_20691 [Thiomonas sp. X19]